MQDFAITFVTWGLVVVFDVLLLFEVHLRDVSESVLVHSRDAGRLVSFMLVLSIAVFSVYTWGLSNIFVYDMLVTAVVQGDVFAWNTAMNHLCIILLFTGLQALCATVLGAYIALESDVYKLLCNFGVVSAQGDTAMLCFLSGMLAVSAVATSAVALHLSQTGIVRPDVLPWDLVYIGLQIVMFMLACVLLMHLRVQKRQPPVYMPYKMMYAPYC